MGSIPGAPGVRKLRWQDESALDHIVQGLHFRHRWLKALGVKGLQGIKVFREEVECWVRRVKGGLQGPRRGCYTLEKAKGKDLKDSSGDYSHVYIKFYVQK